MISPLLKQEIESIFKVIKEKSSPEELVFCCPECNDHSGHRSVNLRTGMTFCWRCNKGKNNKGHFLGWARALGFRIEASIGSGSTPIAEIFSHDNDVGASKMPVLKEVALPEGFTPIAREPKSAYARLITRMAKRKNLDYDDFAKAGAGFTRTHLKWEPYCIFPVIEYGMPVYYQGRTYVDVPGETTKKFPSRTEVQFGAGYWVYNIDMVRKHQPEVVVIVESILNVLSLKRKFAEMGVKHFIPVSVFKHHVGTVQALKLLQCPGVKEFCMLFDRDAIEQTWKVVGSLGTRIKLTIAEMPFRKDNKKLDPNDDVDAACEAIEKRVRYSAPEVIRHRVALEPNAMSERKMDLTGISFGSKRK